MTSRFARAAAAALLVAVLAACGATGSDDPTTPPAPVTSVPEAAPTGPPTGDDVRVDGLALAGTTAVLRAGAEPEVTDTGDGAATVRVTGAGGAGVWVAPPPGGTVAVLGDGSAVVRDAVGLVVAALGRPAAGDGPAPAWQTTGDVLGLDAASATFVVGAAALESATWGEAEGGRSLAVVPAGWVRTGDLAAQEALASQLEAQEPEAATASMRAQLWCHVLGAPDKASWNLEPWRPEVSATTLVATRCNPTDDDL